uniref:AraC family transcriptional regulator n=1 Tax=Enterocloster clostridioformis TaxID=1531 RepID=UPI0026EE45B2|nr:AraC family transcriptional regulator [Enterocloster clostridioformis]
MEKTNLLYYNQIMKEYKETQHTLMYKSTSDLSFYSAGYEECSPGYSYGPRFRSYQLIHFVLSGKGELHINEHVFQLSAGDAFIIPSGKVSYYEASKEAPWCYAWVSFLGINSQRYIYQLMTSSDDIYIIHNLDTEKYKACIFEILTLEGNTTSEYLKANSLLFLIMSSLFEDVSFNENNWGKESVIDEVKFYLDMHYAEKLKLKDVAKSFGVHPNYLTRIFHNKYGMSPKQYLMDIKLKKARRLLTTTELPVSVISSSLGFDDQLAFSRIFKKRYEESPSEYRKKSRAAIHEPNTS